MIRAPLRRIVRDLQDKDEDIATYAAMNILRLKEVNEDEIVELIPVLRRATTNPSISVRFFARKALNEVKLGLRRFPGLMAQAEKLREETRRSSWSDLFDGLLEASVESKLVVIDYLKDIDDPKILPALLQFLEAEQDEFVVAEAIHVVGLVGTSAEIPVLTGYLKHGDSRIRSNAVEALEHIGGKQVVQAILPLLEDDDNRVRATVAKILSKHGEMSVLSALRDMLRSVEVWMRESAIYALGFVPYHESVDLLLEALVDVNPDVRVKAIESLARLHARRALDYLATMAVSGDSAVASAARKALGAIRRTSKDYPHAHVEADAAEPWTISSPQHRAATPPPQKLPQRPASPAAEVQALPDSPAARQLPAASSREGFASRLIGSKKRAGRKELEQLVAAREAALTEIGRQAIALYREKQLDRIYLPAFDAEAKKLKYLIDQKQSQKVATQKQRKKITFISFLRESVSFFTDEKQMDQRLGSLTRRLEAQYHELGRKLVDDYTPAAADLYLLKGLPESVQKMDRQIRQLEQESGG